MNDKVIKAVERLFNESKEYGTKKRKRGAYLYINSKEKEVAVRTLSSEVNVGGVPTGVLEFDGSYFKIEPIFDNKGKYVCEEIIFVGTPKNSDVTLDRLSPNIF